MRTKNEFGKTLNELRNKFGNGGDRAKRSKNKDMLCCWFVFFKRGKGALFYERSLRQK